MCHTALVVAVPTPDDQRTFPNPLTVGLRVVADSKPSGWAWPKVLGRAVARFVRDTLLILAALASITVAAFLLHVVVGFFVLGLSLLLADVLIKMDRTPSGGGS